MSWSINLTSDKDIEESQIDSIVAALPKHLKGYFGGSNQRQEWGWSVCVDINKPGDIFKGDKRCMYISGAAFSGNVAHEMAIHLQNELAKVGHNIKIGEISW